MRKVLDFLDSLVEEGVHLESLYDAPLERKVEGGFTRRYRKWKQSVLEVLGYLGLERYVRAVDNAFHMARSTEVSEVTGLVESARDLIRNGFVGDIKHLLHAEMFETMAEQAKGLLESGHAVPAAVLGRIVLEDWLRDQAEKAGIPAPKGTKAAVVNENLKKASIFSVPKWRQVQVYLDIGNAAAHGDEKGFTQADVEKLLEFIEANCI